MPVNATAGDREAPGLFPVLEGPLGRVLPHRWYATPEPARWEVCRRDTIEEALVEAIAMVHDAHAVTSTYPYSPDHTWVVWLLDGTPDALTKAVAIAPIPEPGQVGLLGHLSVGPQDRLDWTTPTAAADGREDQVLRDRSDLLAARLWQADVLWSTLNEFLVGATTRMPRWRAYLDPAFRHSVESARVMLGLISDAATLSHVTDWPTPEDPCAGLVVDPRVVIPQV